MKTILSTILLTVLAVLVLETAGWFAFLYSGTYNISTYNHDNSSICQRAVETGHLWAESIQPGRLRKLRIPSQTNPRNMLLWACL